MQDVISQAHLSCEEIIIDDLEPNKRIYVIIDGEEYIIRTWDFMPVESDANGEVCAEQVGYTLYKMVEDATGGHGEEISSGMTMIEWENE